jgi:hypothetical protein
MKQHNTTGVNMTNPTTSSVTALSIYNTVAQADSKYGNEGTVAEAFNRTLSNLFGQGPGASLSLDQLQVLYATHPRSGNYDTVKILSETAQYLEKVNKVLAAQNFSVKLNVLGNAVFWQ